MINLETQREVECKIYLFFFSLTLVTSSSVDIDTPRTVFSKKNLNAMR